MFRVHENSLANAVGIIDDRYNNTVVHFRGIKYARISKRFANPELITRSKSQRLDATQFGPKCPQVTLDVRDLMQIPRNLRINPLDKQDEFECCNLNVTCPVEAGKGSLPVLLWIYGGSQFVSFSTAQNRLGDAGPLVAQSIHEGKPIILVTINYRLNIFAQGGGKNEKNLDLQDQKTALQWVKENIADFGGNPDRITVGGESAGAIYTHALIASGTPIKRAILVSGTLHLSPPAAAGKTKAVKDRVTKFAAKIESKKPNGVKSNDLSDYPVESVVQALEKSGLTSVTVQKEPALEGWENDAKVFGNLDALMIGDCDFESILWLQGAKMFPEAAVASCFQTKPPEAGKRIAKMYLKPEKVDPRLGAIKTGGLNFVTDARFAFPVHHIAGVLRDANRKVFQYCFDEINPWAKPGSSTSRAHHAVDLLAIFGGYDDDLPSDMAEVGKDLRGRWIAFINGTDPWKSKRVYGFGPGGQAGELTQKGYEARRRVEQFKLLEELGLETYDGVWMKLAGAANSAEAQSKQDGSKL